MEQSAREAAEQGKGCYRSCHYLEGGVLVGESVKVCCVNYTPARHLGSRRLPSSARPEERHLVGVQRLV